MNHWASKYLGDEWSRENHDCFIFFRRVQKEQFGRDIPAFDVDAANRMACARAVAANPERGNWLPVDVPQEGDAVLLAHAKHPSHIGVWVDVDGGGVLHCVKGPGVVFQKIISLKSGGWGHLEYMRHV